MKVSLWLGPGNRHTLRFDEVELDEIAGLMGVAAYNQRVQVSDLHRNILGYWRARDLRQASAELASLEREHRIP
ncbi:MAG: hypothetical protein KGJ86_07545 [Chloroflexota bacterium]|nr:hypothetical protein [Chloroflexota bacterium]